MPGAVFSAGTLSAREHLPRQEIVAGGLRRLGVADLPLAGEVARAYAALREEGVSPFPGAIETLRALGDAGSGWR
jgi:hypothetical protein